MPIGAHMSVPLRLANGELFGTFCCFNLKARPELRQHDLETMRELDPFLTARGDVYRAQVLGFFDGNGPVHRQEAIIDGTQIPPRVVWQRDLNELGRGYSRAHFAPIPVR